MRQLGGSAVGSVVAAAGVAAGSVVAVATVAVVAERQPIAAVAAVGSRLVVPVVGSEARSVVLVVPCCGILW